MAEKCKGPPEEYRYTRSGLARAMGVDLSTVDAWRRSGLVDTGTPRAPRFAIADVVNFRSARARETAEREDGAIDLDMLRRRRALADTELAELALEEIADDGEGDQGAAQRIVDRAIEEAREGLLGVPAARDPGDGSRAN